MSNEKPYPQFSYDKHARACAPDDFLGQILRTVQGIPLQNDQIKMIIEAIKSGLSLKPNDSLLELACGNGALSHFLFDSCEQYLGTDISEYLISIAKKNFEIFPDYQFSEVGAAKCVQEEQNPEKFSKVLCYAGFQFFPSSEARIILQVLFEKFINVQSVFIGNLPDKDRVEQFYKERLPSIEELLDCHTAIGAWYTQGEFAQISGVAGWKVRFSTMPEEFYASHYRYDALLSR